jgi:hypothetical protein
MKPLCTLCGNDLVHYTIKSFHEWDIDQQCWIETGDKTYAYCDTCDQEDRIHFVNENSGEVSFVFPGTT